jgi:hypothetical protein
MSKKFIALFLLLIFLIIVSSKFLLLTITGFVSESILSLNVANTTLGKFIYFSYPSYINLRCGVVQGDNVTFSVFFENIGNLNITERIEIHVKNSSLDTIASYYDDSYHLSPAGVRNFSVNWTPIKGIYYVIANASYNSTVENKIEEENHIFEVTRKEGIGTLRRFPDQIVETIPPGRTNIYSSGIQLWLEDACNGTIATLNTTKGIPGDWVSLSRNNIYLTPDVVNSTDVNITIPSLIPKGVYDNGSIFIYAGGQTREVRLNITVAMVDFILNITVQEKSVCSGKTITANINITKIMPPEDVNVNITYQIIDSNQTVYDENRDDNVPISNISVQKLYTLAIPSSAKIGHYIFLTKLDYKSNLTHAYNTFEVSSCPTTPETPGGGGGGGGVGAAPIKPKTEVRAIGLNLSADTLTVITGNKTSFIASVKNIGSELVKSVKISIEGVPQDWIRIFPTTTDVGIGEVEEYLVVIDIPNDTTTGIYKLKVKATDDIESNTVILTLIIGRDLKEVSELLLRELEGVRADAKRSLIVEDCINMTTIKTFYQDAESAFEKGMNEYENKNYEGAVNWFEYALPIEKKVVNKVDITLELEIGTLNASKPISMSVIPPFYKPKEQLQLAGTYLQEKNYEKICDPILEIKRLIFVGLVLWSVIVISFVILVIIIVILSKRKRKEEFYKEPELIVPPTY